MKILRGYSRANEFGLGVAIADSLDGSRYMNGTIEDIQATCDKLREAMTRLLVKLHEKNVLSDEEVVAFLDSEYRVEP